MLVAFALAAIVLALVDLVRGKFTSLVAWGVLLLGLALALPFLRTAF